MSGYRHSGMTREEYEDVEALRAAASVIERRWPDRVATGWMPEATAARILDVLEGEIRDDA